MVLGPKRLSARFRGGSSTQLQHGPSGPAPPPTFAAPASACGWPRGHGSGRGETPSRSAKFQFAQRRRTKRRSSPCRSRSWRSPRSTRRGRRSIKRSGPTTRSSLSVRSMAIVGVEMTLIPPGGGKMSQPWRLGKYEVTQAQFTRVMGWNPSEFQGEKAKGADPKTLPVENVRWYVAVELCNEPSKLENLKPVFTRSRKGRQLARRRGTRQCRRVDLGGRRLPVADGAGMGIRMPGRKPFAMGLQRSARGAGPVRLVRREQRWALPQGRRKVAERVRFATISRMATRANGAEDPSSTAPQYLSGRRLYHCSASMLSAHHPVRGRASPPSPRRRPARQSQAASSRSTMPAQSRRSGFPARQVRLRPGREISFRLTPPLTTWSRGCRAGKPDLRSAASRDPNHSSVF